MSETLHYLLATKQERRAAAIKTDLKVPESRFAHEKLRALVHAHNWPALLKFGLEKKLPISLSFFADACIRWVSVCRGRRTDTVDSLHCLRVVRRSRHSAGKSAEALKLVAKMSAPDMKADYLMKLGQWDEALDVCVKAKDAPRLDRIRVKCSAPKIQAKAQQALAALS